MKSSEQLKQLLLSINHRSYPAYKDTRGSYRFDGYQLNIDHVQGDPFAAPSKVSILVSGRQAAFPENYYDLTHKRTALEDHLIRLFAREAEQFQFKARGSGKSGLLSVSRCGQEILSRTACTISPESGDVTVRMEIGFPANGRSINSPELIKILFDFLPLCVRRTLYCKSLDAGKLSSVIKLAEDQHAIRKLLPKLELVAFIANGSVLPRESGVSQRPMRGATPFRSPSSMEVTLTLPNRGRITGMGIRRGITLIIGGGYHGKSTLLKALELGVYNHISGDGREFVITDESAVKIRAEDGRSIRSTDISMFINNLPNKKDTRRFSTEDASGSTSQAAGVIEAIEAGTSLLLIDEDTCATNFMIRDELMQRVVHREQEPITPFIDRVRDLYEQNGISSVMVAGSSGSYFHVADRIIQMDCYVPADITDFAREQAAKFPIQESVAASASLPDFSRVPKPSRDFRADARIKMKTLGRDAFSINRETVDLRYVEQLADIEQTTALSYLLRYAMTHLCDGKKDLRTIVNELVTLTEKQGLAAACDSSWLPAGLAMPRPQEIYACFNRFRGLTLQ